MDAVDQSSIEKHVHSRFAFSESAEQTLFNAFHNIFFHQKTCFILVVDMTRCLDEQLCDENCDSRFKPWTYGGNVEIRVISIFFLESGCLKMKIYTYNLIFIFRLL